VQQTANSVQHGGSRPRPSRLRTLPRQPFSCACSSHECTDGSTTNPRSDSPVVCHKSPYFPQAVHASAGGFAAASAGGRGGLPTLPHTAQLGYSNF